MTDEIRHVAIALITDGARVLVTQRRPDDSFPLYWEFPGGTCEPQEPSEACVVREMREELGVTVAVDAPGPEVVHRYPDWTIRLVSFWCRVTAGTPAPLEVAQLRWVTAEELPEYQFPPASGPLIAAVRDKLAPPHPTSPLKGRGEGEG